MFNFLTVLKRKRKFILILAVIFVLASWLRMYHLNSVPRGMHRDEGWFFYNAFLLNENGTNIYGQKWPLTVDFWGENVSASHSYYGALILRIFGHNQFGFRMTTVTFSLLILVLVSIWLYRLTGKEGVVILAALLYAISPWNIVMTRASSTMLIDILTMMVFGYIYYEGLRWFFNNKNWQFKNKVYLVLWLCLVYLLMIWCYLTYFSSRLLIFPLGIGIFLYVYSQSQKKSWKSWFLILPLIIYFLMPFLYFLNTPYARGRYDETKVINSDLSELIMAHSINYAGQAQVPIWLTRVFFNKITVNAYLLSQQLISFFSPSVIMFATAPPQRYFTPYIGAVTWLEYLGFLAVLGVLFFAKKLKINGALPLFLLFLLGLSSAPAFLTIDDFPNFQRGVMMTPFWQTAAALGLFYVLENLPMKKYKNSLVVMATLSILIPFIFLYYKLSPYAEHTYRNEAEKEVAEWINAEAHESKILIEDTEYLFFYPLLLNEENIFDYEIRRFDEVPQFVISDGFQIGQRLFVRNISGFNQDLYQYDPINEFEPDYIVAKIFENSNLAKIPDSYSLIKNIYYDKHILAYQIYQKGQEENLEITEK